MARAFALSAARSGYSMTPTASNNPAYGALGQPTSRPRFATNPTVELLVDRIVIDCGHAPPTQHAACSSEADRSAPAGLSPRHEALRRALSPSTLRRQRRVAVRSPPARRAHAAHDLAAHDHRSAGAGESRKEVRKGRIPTRCRHDATP